MEERAVIERDGVIYAPLDTEVLDRHKDLVSGTSYGEDGRLLVNLDVRRREWRRLLELPHGTHIGWADVRTMQIRELSSLRRAISYKLTYGDGWYQVPGGERQYFSLQQHLQGIDLQRSCTIVAVRGAVFLAVLSGIGLRAVCWILSGLFHLQVDKSSLDRWVRECADCLPDQETIVKLLHKTEAIRDIHMDELFTKGSKPKHCMLILRDQLGRLVMVRRLEERTEAAVQKVLSEFKSWGMAINTFYVDGCEAYKNAIKAVYPESNLQYDYFHVIHCIFKKLWKSVIMRRRILKARSKNVKTASYGARLSSLALKIWEHRWTFFKRDEHLTSDERKAMLELIEADGHLRKVRNFAKAVWGLFEDSTSETGARRALKLLKRRSEVRTQVCFKKSVEFLVDRFDDMICHKRLKGIQRNSLAETGMRFMRRLEQGHDGFRSDAGLDRHVRLYQAIRYLGWTPYESSGRYGLPT